MARCSQYTYYGALLPLYLLWRAAPTILTMALLLLRMHAALQPCATQAATPCT